MITFAAHYAPKIAYPVNNAHMIMGKCPMCGDMQTYEKFYALHRDVCILSDDLLLCKCWKCGEQYTYSCMKVYRVTDDELLSVPGVPGNWGVPF